jgi:DNA-binding NarL/FixJ family response regulator
LSRRRAIRSHAELAGALGMTVGTLKHYINKIQTRMQVDSRQALIDRILSSATAARTLT